MAINILSSIFNKGKSQATNYLSLVITPDRVLATIWTFEGEHVKTLGFGHESHTGEDILIQQAATAINTAGEQAKVNIKKTVFGLSEYYLEEGSLARTITKTLKRLSTELDLDPQAFVPISAGINHLLKVEEQQTPHVVLIGIFGSFCEVHLLQNGEVEKSNSTESALNIEKIESLLKHLKDQDTNLPSRIIVYGTSESTPLAEKIAKNDWGEIFVHEPKVNFIDDYELSRSVAYAQAADVLGYDPTTEEASKEEAPKETNEFGFVEGEDILLTQKETKVTEEPKVPKESFSKENGTIQQKQYQQEQYAVDTYQSPPLVTPERHESTKKEKRPLLSLIPIPNFTTNIGKKILIAAVALILLLAIGAFIATQTLTNAEVTIMVNGQDFQKSFQATVFSGASYSKDNAQIGGRTISGKSSGSQKAVTSGSKKIGDPAKGEITVYNWTNSQKAFTKGTGIITKSGIKFTLDGDIEVASRSATTPGEKNVNAVAVEVGPSGNLQPGQDFNFQEFDELSFSAINKGAFAGGAERQTTVVTQEDMDRLQKSLLESTTQKAKEDLKSQMGTETLYDDAIVVKVQKLQFDKKLEEEASLLNLDIEIEANALVFSESELKKLLAEIFAPDIGQNLQILPEDIIFADTEIARNGDEMEIAAKARAKIVPKFNEDELKEKIKGKSIKDTRATIKGMSEVSEVEVNFKPNIPIVSSIPRNKNKITFKVETI